MPGTLCLFWWWWWRWMMWWQQVWGCLFLHVPWQGQFPFHNYGIGLRKIHFCGCGNLQLVFQCCTWCIPWFRIVLFLFSYRRCFGMRQGYGQYPDKKSPAVEKLGKRWKFWQSHKLRAVAQTLYIIVWCYFVQLLHKPFIRSVNKVNYVDICFPSPFFSFHRRSSRDFVQHWFHVGCWSAHHTKPYLLCDVL